MAKLRGQFQELLVDVGLMRMVGRMRGPRGGGGGGGARERGRGRDAGGGGGGGEGGKGKRGRGGPHHLRSGALHAAKKRLRELQQERDRQRGKKVRPRS